MRLRDAQHTHATYSYQKKVVTDITSFHDLASHITMTTYLLKVLPSPPGGMCPPVWESLIWTLPEGIVGGVRRGGEIAWLGGEIKNISV